MKFCLPIALLATSFIATHVEAKWHPGPNVSWDYLLGADEKTMKESDKDVVTIDLEYAERYTSHFHSKGQKVICYFSGGTMQKDRAIDYQDYKKANIGTGVISSWGNEYIDIRKKDKIAPLIRNRMKRAKRYGCDGVEVDSLGVYGHVSKISKEDSYEFAKMIAEIGHSVDIAVGLKNCPAIAEQLEKYFDFAVNESCAEFNECRYYNNFADHGKAVFMVHYEDRGHHLSGSALKKLTEKQGGHNFVCVLAPNKDLDKHSTTYNCKNGSIIKHGSKASTTTTTTKTSKPTTTTAKPVIPTVGPVKQATDKTAATTAKSVTAANAANAANAAGAANAANAANATKAPNAANAATKKPADEKKTQEVNSVVEEQEGGSSVATVLGLTGGVATAAVAGFVFLKKNKKFHKDEAEVEETETNEVDPISILSV